MEEIIIKLEKIVNEKSKYNLIAKYILDNIDQIQDITLQKIANETYTSISTITRMCQTIGLSGFNELKYLLKQKNQINKYELKNIKVMQDYKMQLDNTYELLTSTINYDDLLITANLIYNAKNVYLIGIGGSKVNLIDFGKKILRLGINVVNEIDIHYQEVNIRNAKKNDVIIFNTYSGMSSEILKLINISKVNDAKKIIISQNEELKDYADIFILIPKTENLIRGFSITSRLSVMMILDFIYIEIIKNNEENFNKILEETRIKK